METVAKESEIVKVFRDYFANIVKGIDAFCETITLKKSDPVLSAIKNFENHPNIPARHPVSVFRWRLLN